MIGFRDDSNAEPLGNTLGSLSEPSLQGGHEGQFSADESSPTGSHHRPQPLPVAKGLRAWRGMSGLPRARA
eukprot:11021947-Alexandrium_andersonii.AAC.1